MTPLAAISIGAAILSTLFLLALFAAARRRPLVAVCFRCGSVIGADKHKTGHAPDPDDELTHGICAECLAVELNQFSGGHPTVPPTGKC